MVTFVVSSVYQVQKIIDKKIFFQSFSKFKYYYTYIFSMGASTNLVILKMVKIDPPRDKMWQCEDPPEIIEINIEFN